MWKAGTSVLSTASGFRKAGYRPVDRDGIAQLVWKPFTEDASPPGWIRQKKKPGIIPGKVTVSGFINGVCPAQNIAYERAKRAVAEFDDRVEFQSFNASDPEVLEEWGMSDALFIDNRQVRTGPPPSYEKIRKKIAKRVKKL